MGKHQHTNKAPAAPPVRKGPAGAPAAEERPPEQAEAVERAPWRTVAVVRRACTVYLGGGLSKLLGGDIIDHPPHVDQVGSDPSFELVDLDGPDDLEQLREQFRTDLADLRERAAELGCVVYRDGEVKPPRVLR